MHLCHMQVHNVKIIYNVMYTYVHIYSMRQKKVANTVYRSSVLMLIVYPFPFRFQRRSVFLFLSFYRFTVPFCRFTVLLSV